jgi:NAD(P)-dependent dehydrogenase (short-subunit alcohol dehydrogenase family)
MKNKVVIITGGAKGIGRHAAHTLAKEGAKLTLADTDVERLHKTVAEIKSTAANAFAVPTDVRDEKDVRRLVHEVVDRFGRIDALINDAGIVPHFNWGIPRWPRTRFMSKDFWDSVIQTNLGGTFLCTKYVVPGISSICGAAAEPRTMGPPLTSSAKTPSAPSHASWPRKNASGTSAWLPSALNKPSRPRMLLKKPASVYPVLRFWGTALCWRHKPEWSSPAKRSNIRTAN